MNKDNLALPKQKQDPSTKLRQTIPRIRLRRILELLHTAVGKTGVSSGKSVGRDDRLWHLKSPALLKATSQSLRIPLWHLKSPALLKAVSQSLRIRLALNSLIRTPVSLAEKHSKAKTGKQSQNSASPNSGVLAQGVCTRQGGSGAKTPLP